MKQAPQKAVPNSSQLSPIGKKCHLDLLCRIYTV